MAKTFGTGADPKGLVARGVEGSGAAQIFRPSQAVQDFVTRQARGEQQKAAEKKAEAKAKAEKQKADEKAIQGLLDIDLIGWNEKRNSQLMADFNAIQDEAAKMIATGQDISQSKDLLIKKKMLEQKVDLMKLERTEYSNAVKDLARIAKDPNYDPEELKVFANNIDLFEQGGIGENDFTLLIRPTPKKPIDIPSIINKSIDIGYFEDTDLDEQGIGVTSKTVKQNDLLSQSKALVEANDKLYNEGIRKGLWGDKEEAAKWVSNFKLWQADTSVKDIFRSTAANNVFGSGANETQVNEDFQKWKTDLFSGNENAAAYLFGVKLPSGEALKRNKLLPSRGKQTAGAIYEYETESTATTVDGTKVRSKGKFEFAPQAMNEQELYKLYLQSLEDRKRTYGMDLSKKSSGTSFIQSSSQSATPTTTKPSGTSAKKPKPY